MNFIHSYFAVLCAALSFATSTTFANSFEFTVDGYEPLYQTQLPKASYQFTHSNTLDDLTITNAADEQVPYALMAYEQLNPPTTKQDKKPLPVYPIQESSLDNPSKLQIQLEKSAGKTTVNINENQAKSHADTVYLLDAGVNHPALDTVAVEWQGSEGKLITLEVLGSDNLKTWSSVGHGALLKTKSAGNSILQNTITLDSPTTRRYLQIKPLEHTANGGFKLTQATSIYSYLETNQAPLHWQMLKVLGREQTKKSGQINMNYEAVGRFPASQLRIKLPQPNTITTVVIATRNNTNEPWVNQINAAVFDMLKDNKKLINPDIVISPTVARYWQLQFNEANGGIGAGDPSLELGWQPHTVVWNARGQAPFTLHVGEKPGIVNTVNIANLIPDYKLEKVQQLPAALLQVIADENDLTATITAGNSWETPPDYKRWLLWGGLVLGVLLLAGMAYSLLKTGHNK